LPQLPTTGGSDIAIWVILGFFRPAGPWKYGYALCPGCGALNPGFGRTTSSPITRTSRFKRSKGEIVLRAEFEMRRDDPPACIARMNAYTEHRRRTQPTEASVGSMFKNPPGEFAGRLIEQARLKGTRVGNVEVSRVHANFFVNLGGGTASQVLSLVEVVRNKVKEEFGMELELEIEVVGSEP
jgi:UDP-N-acetylenolpyruvoylglucosamine reductase